MESDFLLAALYKWLQNPTLIVRYRNDEEFEKLKEAYETLKAQYRSLEGKYIMQLEIIMQNEDEKRERNKKW